MGGGGEADECADGHAMNPGKKRTWLWAAAGLVIIQIFGLVGLLEMRRGEGGRGREWAFDAEAAVAEAKGEKEFREALRNLPKPEGRVRLTVAGAKAAAPQVEDLLEQARELQNRGQFDLAEKLLEQARGQKAPQERVKVASALLAEARGETRVAWERWRDLIAGSEAGGAMRKLALARSKILEERVRLEQLARQREETLAKNPRKIALVKVEEKAGRVQWTVRAIGGEGGLKASKVGVRVQFFERGGDGVLQKSEAGLARWGQGPPLAEADGLRVVACEPKVGLGSTYVGYTWQIFYDGELQDERVQPNSLRAVLREKPRS